MRGWGYLGWEETDPSKKVPALTQVFEWADAPGVEVYFALEQGKRYFLPRKRTTYRGVRPLLTESDSFPSPCLYRIAFQIFTFWHLA